MLAQHNPVPQHSCQLPSAHACASMCSGGRCRKLQYPRTRLQHRRTPLTAYPTALPRRNSAYSAPELVRHGRAGPAGDVYAFAVVLWELALGAPLPALLARPEGARVCEWLAAQAQLDPEEASALPPDLLVWPGHLPPAFSALVGDCLHADPASRPSSFQVCCRLDAMLLDAGWDDS